VVFAFVISTTLGLRATAIARGTAADTTDPVEAHFQAGVAAAKQGRFDRAREHYLEAWKLRKSHDVAANLGGAELQLGLYRDAAEHLRYALDHLAASKASEAGRRIEQDLETAKQHVGTLLLTVEPPNANVTLNGRLLGIASALPAEIYAEPGTVKLSATLEGHEPKTVSVSLQTADTREVSVALTPERAETPAPASGPASPPLTPLPPPEPYPRTKKRNLVPVFIGAAVTVVALGAGIGFAIDSGSADNQSLDALNAARARFGEDSACAPGRGAGSAECDDLQDLRDRRTRSGNIANTSFIIAGAATLFTAGAYLLWPKTERITALRLLPIAGPNESALILTGRF
jgi:tetratricopeptide (TPR) repeat protein